MADSRAGRKGTRRVHGEGRACNSFQIKKKESWRRGESNDTPLLITRNLLKKRDAQNAITALCPIPMYKIMYNEIGRCGVAHRLRCYEDCEKLLRVRFKSPSLGSARFVDVRAAFVAQREAAEAMQPGQGCVRQPSGRPEAAAMTTAGLGGPWTLPAPWTPRTRPPPSLLVMTLRTDKRRRACAQLGLTRYSQPLPLAGFSNVRQFGNRKSSENHCINTV